MEGTNCQRIELEEQPMDCQFHPTGNLIAAGLIDGVLEIFDCSSKGLERKQRVKMHDDSCRAVRFAAEGCCIVTGSADRSIAILDSIEQKMLARLTDAHDAAVNRIAHFDAWHFSSGDDDGTIKTWDIRQRKFTHKFQSHKDYITDMVYVAEANTLLAVSGDGSLSIHDLRLGKVQAISDGDPDEELLSLAVLKKGKKVVCGSQQGSLNIFSWGNWEAFNDSFPGHPSSVEALIKLDEDTMISASGDGVLRIVAIQPHKLLGVVGEQPGGGGERIALSNDNTLLAATTYTSSLDLWDTSVLNEDAAADTRVAAVDSKEGASSDDDDDAKSKKKRKMQRKGDAFKQAAKSHGFFNDLLQS